MREPEFRERVMSLQRLMYSIALKTGLSPDSSGDVVQETLLKLWRARKVLPDEDALLRAYCLRVLRNECVSFFRCSRPNTSLEEADTLKSPPDSMETEACDTQRYIERLINTLPEAQRRIIRMSCLSGFSVSEISEATGFTPENIRQLLSRGRKRLRLLLKDYPNEK